MRTRPSRVRACDVVRQQLVFTGTRSIDASARETRNCMAQMVSRRVAKQRNARGTRAIIQTARKSCSSACRGAVVAIIENGICKKRSARAHRPAGNREA